MKLKEGVLCITMVISCQSILNSCATYQGKQIFGNNLLYTTANLVSDSQQSTILSLYSNLTKIEDYNIDLQYKIYSNKNPLCNKTDPSILQINAYNDAWLCFDQFYLLKCNQVWELVLKCGTEVEIHRPFDPEILISMDLEDISWILDEYGVSMVNMDLERLCAGMYHLWFVYYSRMGKFLKGVKPIYITYPSCNC